MPLSLYTRMFLFRFYTCPLSNDRVLKQYSRHMHVCICMYMCVCIYLLGIMSMGIPRESLMKVWEGTLQRLRHIPTQFDSSRNLPCKSRCKFRKWCNAYAKQEGSDGDGGYGDGEFDNSGEVKVMALILHHGYGELESLLEQHNHWSRVFCGY